MPSGLGLGDRKGDEAGTSITLGGEDGSIELRVGLLSSCVGWVVSRSRRKAEGEQGIVSPASSSSSKSIDDFVRPVTEPRGS